MARYDVIIKNGTVFDGKGNKPQRIDIGIEGDEIKKIGSLENDEAEKIINIAGKYVAPGFIDLTNHSDNHWTLFAYPSQENLLRQGITTILGGNCGSSLAPIVTEESIEEIKRWTDISKININWQTTGELFDELDRHKLGVNFCTCVGFNTAQRGVLGKETRMPDHNEIAQIKFLIKSSLDEGAFGLSTNLGLTNIKSLRDEEIVDVFGAAKEYDVVIKHHLEDEGENLLPAVSRVISLARKSGTRTHISHFKALGKNSWNFFAPAIEMIKNARAEGVKITCDFYPYKKTGSSLITLLPAWFRKLSDEEAMAILRSEYDSRRKNLLDDLRALTLHHDNIIIAGSDSVFGFAGKTIERLGKDSDLAGEEIILKLLETNDLRVSIFNEVILPENIELIAKETFSAISSDGVGYSLMEGNSGFSITDLPHPRSFGAFPRAFTSLIKTKGILSWEDAIYKATGLPAHILGIKDRGMIIEGNKADIVIFDPSKIADRADYENPLQYSTGVSHLLVNGKIVLEEGGLSGELAGKVLRRKTGR